MGIIDQFLVLKSLLDGALQLLRRKPTRLDAANHLQRDHPRTGHPRLRRQLHDLENIDIQLVVAADAVIGPVGRRWSVGGIVGCEIAGRQDGRFHVLPEADNRRQKKHTKRRNLHVCNPPEVLPSYGGGADLSRRDELFHAIKVDLWLKVILPTSLSISAAKTIPSSRIRQFRRCRRAHTARPKKTRFTCWIIGMFCWPAAGPSSRCSQRSSRSLRSPRSSRRPSIALRRPFKSIAKTRTFSALKMLR